MLDVARLRVLVVGGGAVAARKVASLVDAGGGPVVVAPELGEELRAVVKANELTWFAREYRPVDVEGFHLVFAATNSAEVNEAVAEAGRRAGALVSRADEGGESDFQVPSHLRREQLVVAISTGGASPLLARRIGERLDDVVTPGLGRAARRLAEARTDVQARWAGDEGRRRAFWFSLITPEFLDLAIEGRDDEVERAIARCLSQS
jgi:siroheme synthase-like protein